MSATGLDKEYPHNLNKLNCSIKKGELVVCHPEFEGG